MQHSQMTLWLIITLNASLLDWPQTFLATLKWAIWKLENRNIFINLFRILLIFKLHFYADPFTMETFSFKQQPLIHGIAIR